MPLLPQLLRMQVRENDYRGILYKFTLVICRKIWRGSKVTGRDVKYSGREKMNRNRKNIAGSVLTTYISCTFAVQPVSDALMGDAEAFKHYSPATKLADGYLV